MLSHFDYQIKTMNHAVYNALRCQCMDPQSPTYGTIEDLNKGYTSNQSGLSVARQYLEGYYAPQCAYAGNKLLLERAGLGVDYAIRMQNEDGTSDLLETNFHDASQTAFDVMCIGPATLLMRRFMGDSAEEKALFEKLLYYINRCADGLLVGGFHTPNHRWVHSAALAICHELTGRRECEEKMNRFLDEGIDCDEEGEYTERSSGGYNVICDKALIILAQVRGMTEMYDHVARNLRMVEKYFEPDLTINTLNSTRQDVGSAPDWRIYFSSYLYMALATGDEEFRYLADQMLVQSCNQVSLEEHDAIYPHLPYFDFMPFWLMDEKMQNTWTEAQTKKPNLDYVKHFVKSGIVRARKGLCSLTLLENRPVFAKLQYAEHSVYLRLAGTFYAQGQFAAQSITETEDGFRMTYRRRAGYKGQFAEKPPTSVWSEMDHSKRPQVMMQDFVFHVDVKFDGDGATFHVTTEGVEHVLTKFEIMLEPGALYVTDAMEMHGRGGDYIYQKSDRADYRYADHRTLCIGGGCWKNSYGEQMRGALPVDNTSVFVAMTSQTPMDETFTLHFRG